MKLLSLYLKVLTLIYVAIAMVNRVLKKGEFHKSLKLRFAVILT